MQAFVTGGTGFIGSHLVHRLLKTGFEVKILCRSVSLANKLFGTRVKLCEGDLLDYALIKKAMRGCPIIFHLAGYAKNWAKYPEIFFDVNVTGTRNILEAAKELGTKKVVATSTVLTLPPASNLIPSYETAQPLTWSYTSYQASKIEMEKIVDSYVYQGLSVVLVNPTRVFGPGRLSEANSVTRMIQQYLKGQWRLIPGNGKSVGNYGFVKDVVKGFLAASHVGRSGERYILGGENLSFNQFFECISRCSGIRRHMIHVPKTLALSLSAFFESLAKITGIYPLITPGWTQTFLEDWAVSSNKAIRELGYSITPFPEAVRQTLQWLSVLEQNGKDMRNEEYQYVSEF